LDDKYVVEIGGKNKSFKQIKDVPNSYVIADDIEVGFGNKIPLWLFGFLYWCCLLWADNMKLNLLVLRCKSIQITKMFYEKLGLIFVQEQHGKGAVHYATHVDEMVLELYPLKEGFEIEQSRLGFSVAKGLIENMKNDVVSQYEFNGQKVFVVQDPDGRKVELVEEVEADEV